MCANQASLLTVNNTRKSTPNRLTPNQIDPHRLSTNGKAVPNRRTLSKERSTVAKKIAFEGQKKKDENDVKMEFTIEPRVLKVQMEPLMSHVKMFEET